MANWFKSAKENLINMKFDILQDLGEMAWTENSLRQSETLQSIINSIAEGVIIADRDGKFIYFNRVAQDILGIVRQDVDPSQWTAVFGCFYPDQVTPYPSEQLPLALAMKNKQVHDELIFIKNAERPEGVFINVSAGPIRDAAGNPNGGTVIIRDVTREKYAIKKTLQSEQELKKLSSAVEQTADSVIITDPMGAIVYVNPAFEKTTGYAKSEILGKNPNVLQSGRHDKTFYKKMWKTISHGKPWQASIINKKKNGELYWCEQTITPMKDQEENISNYVSVIRDITDRKHRQEHEFQMRIAQEVQSHLSKAQKTLPGFDIACFSHSAVQTSGDYYDYFTMFDGSTGLCIADVSGHGIGAALIMAGTRAYLRALTKMSTDPAVILNALNQELYNDLGNNHYVTLMMARIDPEKKMLEYASAGHVPAFLVNGSGEPVALKSTGIPLGWIKDYKFEKSEPVPLNQGSLVVFITDGLSEAHAADDTEFGYERILDVIRTHRSEPAQMIANLLYEKVCSHVGNAFQEDDITSVICKLL